MRTGRWAFWLLLPAAVAAMTTGVNAVAAEHVETLATSAGAPVTLGAEPVAVTLAPPAAGKALSARVASVGENRKGYLVARGLGTDEPPETIYQIYLGLPHGVAPLPHPTSYFCSLTFS